MTGRDETDYRPSAAPMNAQTSKKPKRRPLLRGLMGRVSLTNLLLVHHQSCCPPLASACPACCFMGALVRGYTDGHEERKL